MRHRWSIANAVLAPFGRACVKFGEWPHRAVVEMTIAALRDAAGEVSGEGGTAAGEVRNFYFKLRGCRLCGGISSTSPSRRRCYCASSPRIDGDVPDESYRCYAAAGKL
jgi:hypothetical protein